MLPRAHNYHVHSRDRGCSRACGPDKRVIENTGWTTRKRKDGRTAWIPPQVNNYHHPERYLIDKDEQDKNE
jgi:hypothetical protein